MPAIEMQDHIVDPDWEDPFTEVEDRIDNERAAKKLLANLDPKHREWATDWMWNMDKYGALNATALAEQWGVTQMTVYNRIETLTKIMIGGG